MSRNTVLALIAIVFIAVVGVLLGRHQPTLNAGDDGTPVAIDGFDPANEGRLVSLHGTLSVETAPKDEALGLVADGQAILLRDVRMYQWQEICEFGACRYEGIWASQRIDSTPFQTHTGHANPEFPFGSASLLGGGLRVGDLDVAPAVVTAAVQPVDYAIDPGQLPPNLAASFEVRNGELYSGAPDQPRIGDLHVRYRSIPAGAINVTAIQRGSRLEPIPTKES